MDIATAKNEIATGNRECVQFLERWLKEAKRGMMSHVAMAAFFEPDQILTESVGAIMAQDVICGGLDTLRRKIERMVSDRIMPHDPEMPANQVTLNVTGSTLCFDFICWLIGAEMARIRAGAPGPLKVCLYRAVQKGVPMPPTQAQMLDNVIIPAVSMIGGEINRVPGGRSDFCMLYKDVVAYYKAGEAVPKLKSLPAAKIAVEGIMDGLERPIVITLREAPYTAHRNSNLSSWIKFARDLTAKGELVVFVRDTAKAEEEIEGFATFAAASSDLHMRLALYEHAKMNLFVANGPAMLNWHIDTPFLMFSELDPKHQSNYEAAYPEWWLPNMGIEAGAQFPWFNERQKIVWERDTYRAISAAYEAFIS
jgi:hypothetical protein